MPDTDPAHAGRPPVRQRGALLTAALLAASIALLAPPLTTRGPAQLRLIKGGGHCGYLDQADLIGLICGRQTLAQDAQRALGRAALTAKLRGQLMHDEAASERAWQPDSAGGTSVEARGVESP